MRTDYVQTGLVSGLRLRCDHPSNSFVCPELELFLSTIPGKFAQDPNRAVPWLWAAFVVEGTDEVAKRWLFL
jgi:hypothetical protein